MVALALKPSAAEAADVVDRIRHELLSEDLDRFAAMLETMLEPQRRYLTDIERSIYRSGKKLRPMMLLLSARMLHGTGRLPEKVIQGAASLEMLHVATLIHDDIIDKALLRRGMASVNAARGSDVAIIIGDMQFVQAVRGFVEAIHTQSDMGLVKLVLDVAFRICCGELDELQTDPASSTAELHARYLRTIERKTAVLFGLACESGITLVEGRTSAARRAGFYGRRVGRAFQIMDDLFDFAQDEEASGKPRGMDLAQRRVSLPIIYAMQEFGDEHPVTRRMRNGASGDEDLPEGIDAVRRAHGFSRAYAEARAQSLDALEYLRPFPDNRYRRALHDLSMYVVDRGY